MREIVRHQLGSIISTVVDFGTMILSVELLGVPAVPATIMGASAGAVTNFTLGRKWIFKNHSGSTKRQAIRYAMVSAASAGWNAIGEWILHDRLGVQYLLARAVVAIVVSLAWNYTMQRRFVFT